MNKNHNVFVYGTLRKGESNHHFLSHAIKMAKECWTYGEMFDTGNGYPAIITSNTNKILGELYMIDANELKRLDMLEGYVENGVDNLYERIVQTIFTRTGSVDAFVYITSNEHLLATRIVSGDWCKYRLQK